MKTGKRKVAATAEQPEKEVSTAKPKGKKMLRKKKPVEVQDEDDSPAEYVPTQKNMAKIEQMLKDAEEEEKQEGKKKKTLKDIIAKKKEERKEKRKERQQKDLGRPMTSKEKLKLKLKNIKEHSLTKKKNVAKKEKAVPMVKSTPCMYLKAGKVCPHAQCRYSEHK